MACHFPRDVWKKAIPNPDTGKYGFTFRFSEGLYGINHQVACGQCIGCRLDWAADWATRCEKEAMMHERNAFVTLTYSDEELPLGSSTRSTVSKREFQLFLKRLRFARGGERVRYFGCGEYGERSGRAHYHALLFGVDFPDQRLWKRGRHGSLYVSSELSRLWPFGFSTVGAVNYKTAQYVAQYVVKKARVREAWSDREPPFVLMSRKPGIGASWFERFSGDVFPAGRVVVAEGVERRVPRFFVERQRRMDISQVDAAKLKRRPGEFVSVADRGRRLRAKAAKVATRLSLSSREVSS